VTADDVLVVAAVHPDCRVLGPGSRFAIWVQGCPLSCRECVSPQWIPFAGGTRLPVGELVTEVADVAVDGLTISGGEPFAQAAALAKLITGVRERRDLSVLCYTGFSRAGLEKRGTPAQHALLAQLDVLIDGPYVAARHGDLRWRGSANQRIHRLTDRIAAGPDESAGLQLEITADGDVQWLGVPPVRGFRAKFERVLGVEPADE
jgi:anaerobic ribonucleoside-triphosphate reductase activating protein